MAQHGQAALDWAKHEGEIRDLFVSKGKTLNEVMAHMKKEHNFQATYINPHFMLNYWIIKLMTQKFSARQYKSRFPKLKNVKAEEWIWIAQEMQHRAALGKESEPYLHDKLLPLDRVVREIARHKNKAPAKTRLPNPSPGRISVRTPPPMAAIASGPNPNPLGSIMGSPVELYAPQVYFEASSTQQLPLEVALVEEPLHRLDVAMEIEPEIDANFLINCVDLSSEWDISAASDFDFNFPPVNSLSPTTITRQIFSFSAVSSPRPQSGGQRLSPFSQFINLELIDARPDFQLLTNLPYFRLQSLVEQPEYVALAQIHPALDGVLLSPTSTSIVLPTEARRDALSKLLGIKLELQLPENIFQVTSKLQRLVPERYEGELSSKVGQILDARSTGASSLSSLFGLAAYFASNNTPRAGMHIDAFLAWVIEQKYTDYLERFLRIDTPTVHAFTTQILESAIRIRNVKFLTALLDRGVKFDSVLYDIFFMGNMEFMKLVLSKVSSTCFKGTTGIGLFHNFVVGSHFDLARALVQNGVSVNDSVRYGTPLYCAVSYNDVRMIRFLLSLGADVNSVSYQQNPATALGKAASLKNVEVFMLLLEHGANISCTVAGKDLLEWSALNCRSIYSLLRGKFGSITDVVTIGDLVDAARKSRRYLRAYISKYEGQVTTHQLEEALGESIRLEHLGATIALLQHGVSPDCYTLKNRPLWIALDSPNYMRRLCKLLIKFKANVNVPGILQKVVRIADLEDLQLFVISGANIEEQGMEALVESAIYDDVLSAAFLLDSGVDVNTPGLAMNPLESAAKEGNLDMFEFLLTRGADINAPAYPDGGRTALQSALEGEFPTQIVGLLLDKGAEIFAPPALVDGLTALEAISHNWGSLNSIDLFNQLLDAGAPVNRPNMEPSSTLHGVIEQGWEETFARILEPQRNAIITYMWCNEKLDEDDYNTWEPRTPTQLAVDYGRLKFVKMLLDRGADINEGPGYRFGRTALQAATSNQSPHMELVQFLLERGAHINAKPAIHGGITALQGAAISGDIMLAKLLLEKGAEVNAAPSPIEGRYAIEGAAEHGRLDMVQLLLNAGAKGNVFRGTGFQYAIELAERNHYFAVANLLKTR